MTTLAGIPPTPYDAIAALDNALPHLTTPQLTRALGVIHARLKPRGLFLASIRDYDTLLQTHPTMQPPAIYRTPTQTRIVHQVWDWTTPTTYTLHLYLTLQQSQLWTTHHHATPYHALRRADLTQHLTAAGFEDIQWLTPAESAFYQPIVLATRSLTMCAP
jgi:glycine/sarcosine N-methyltransferase